MDAFELLVGGRTGLDRPKRKLRTLDRGTCGFEAFRSLRVVPVRAMPEEAWIGQENGVSHELPLATPR